MKFELEALDVLPAHGGRIRCGPEWHLDANWSKGLRDYDLWYVWAGRGRIQTGQGPVDLYPGRALWLFPGNAYEAGQSPDDHLGVTFIHFRLKRGARLLALVEFIPPGEVFDVSAPDYFDAASAHAVQMMARPDSVGAASLLIKSLLMEMVAGARRAEARNGSKRHHRDAIARGISRIQAHVDHPPSVRELARQAGYSPDHFSRIFRQVTGLFPKEFMLRCRMERAVALLRESSQTITQISDALGYEDVGFFSKQFKKKIGLSPSHFRARR